jgi:acetoin:2,6-dichlorophenolindophenol oxidoreductase subunit alpha
VKRARAGRGPSFILATCPRMEGHFLGDPLLRVYREPVKQTLELAPGLTRAMLSKPAASLLPRCGYLGYIGKVIATLGGERYLKDTDPLRRAARLLPGEAGARLDEEARGEVAEAVAAALERRKRHA